MKIALDALNLGLLQGTGIATYAKEISRYLQMSGHQIFPLYGQQNVIANHHNSWPQFLQRLAIHGEADNADWKKWFYDVLKGLPKSFLSIPFSANQIINNKTIISSPLKDKLPSFEQIYNIPSIYKISNISAALTNKTTLIKFDKSIDLIHLTCPIPVSCRGVPKVVTVHDIIPIVLPTSTNINLNRYFKIVDLSLRDAKKIFTVSESSKFDLVKHFNVAEEKIHVTYQAVNIPANIKSADNESIRYFLSKNYNLHLKKYFIFYGAIEPKKNVRRILEAFSIAKTEYPILIIGKNGWLYDDVKLFFDQISSSGLKNSNKFLRVPYLTNTSLMFLIKGARGLVFPSLYEGFGLPILEAMNLGCPVITSKFSSMPEVGGNAVHYVDPYDVQDIAEAIDKFSNDDIYLNDLIEKGYSQAEKFSTESYYKKLDIGYNEAFK